MKTSLLPLAVIVLFAIAPALAQPLTCPAIAPSSWGLANARLESVRVLSYPAGEQIDDSGPLPIMAPGQEREHGGTLLQIWRMNTDAPKYIYKFDCLFTGTDRFLRIEASTVKRCTATSRQADKSFSFHCK
ncbi:STY0301 family protein [Janthinobacterium sp. HH01]|uniref:STY0301 family protein n=1 Tax=Janthinobacterium sp. HH01 TaxID=1198452 RepID=UPI001268D3AB|nr:STY0301 family protein [Janthinobacterium sp. HH01]